MWALRQCSRTLKRLGCSIAMRQIASLSQNLVGRAIDRMIVERNVKEKQHTIPSDKIFGDNCELSNLVAFFEMNKSNILVGCLYWDGVLFSGIRWPKLLDCSSRKSVLNHLTT